MDESLYTREPRAEREGSPESEGSTLRKHSGKLKNKDTAGKYYRQKLRTGKADNSLTPEEKRHRDKLRKQGKKKAAELERARTAAEKARKDAAEKSGRNAGKNSGQFSEAVSGAAATMGILSDVVNSTDDGKGESTVSEEAFETGGYVASGAASHVTSKVRTSKYGSKVHGRKELTDGSGDTAKERAKKELQRKMLQKQKKAADNGGKIGRKITDKAEDLVSLLAEHVEEFIADNPIISLIIALVLIVLLVFAGFLYSCSALGSAGGDTSIATTYTAHDEDILGAEDDYKELEEGLQDDIDDIATDYEDYDEINYHLDEIGHNPYKLAAILTVIFENYKREQVQAKLQEIFDLQYDLTLEKTGLRWIEDDSYEDGGYWASYTVNEDEEYDYYILDVYLVNHGLDEVAAELFTEDEMARYEVLVETYGNKKYLFGEEDYYNTDDEHPGDSDEHHVPGEYLSDEQFARMLAEAERYLGVPYVWGGYSPSGFDCSGFVSWVINHCGNGWNFGRLTANGLRAKTSYVSPSEAKPGDLIFFQGTYDTSGASHVGIYVGGGWMIHAGNPVHYSRIDTPYWQSHFLEFGRLP